MKLFTLLVFIFISFESLAKTHCVCEIGVHPLQESFFSAGCDIWLNQQKCNSSSIIQIGIGETLSDYLPNLKNGDTIKASYVGHWYNSTFTERYIERHLLPIAQEYDVDINYDNTACNPMDDPYGVQNYLMSLDISPKSSISVKGSQGLSIGMWDVFFIGKANFYAYASTKWSQPGFWPCENIEGKRCAKKYQSGESGKCYDRAKKKLTELICQAGDSAYKWLR